MSSFNYSFENDLFMRQPYLQTGSNYSYPTYYQHPAPIQEQAPPVAAPEQPIKRGRGRPRTKVRPSPDAPKRKPGRPLGSVDTVKRLRKGMKAEMPPEEYKALLKQRQLLKVQVEESAATTAESSCALVSHQPSSSSVSDLDSSWSLSRTSSQSSFSVPEIQQPLPQASPLESGLQLSSQRQPTPPTLDASDLLLAQLLKEHLSALREDQTPQDLSFAASVLGA